MREHSCAGSRSSPYAAESTLDARIKGGEQKIAAVRADSPSFPDHNRRDVATQMRKPYGCRGRRWATEKLFMREIRK